MRSRIAARYAFCRHQERSQASFSRHLPARDLLGKRTQIVNAIADCRLLRRRVMGQMQRRRTQCLLSLQG